MVEYNGSMYRYVHNLQGDIVGIIDSAGSLVVEYRYDAWGKPLSVMGTLADTLGKRNPFRYRGYVYDEETGLYYLQSRYYISNLLRFINLDTELSTSLYLLKLGLFSYCINNPIRQVDFSGKNPGDLFDTIDDAARDFAFYTNPRSIEENIEYGSYVYTITVTEELSSTDSSSNGLRMTVKNITQKYSYIEPISGSQASVAIPKELVERDFNIMVAVLHTHSAYDPDYIGYDFSDTDISNAQKHGLLSYVATPLGTLRRYTPSTNENIILFDDIPFDPMHPERKKQ